MNDIFKYLIGVTGITGAIIFLSKEILKWLSKTSIEKYKTELNKEIIKYQSSLDKTLEEFKIKYSKIHIEQVDIIKNLYSKLIKAEKPLEYLMRPIKINSSKTKDEQAEEVIKYANEFFDYFDENEIVFQEETCDKIHLIRKKYIEVWSAYSMKEWMNEDRTSDIYRQIMQDMRTAYDNILQVEIQDLKRELKIDFRNTLGVCDKQTE